MRRLILLAAALVVWLCATPAHAGPKGYAYAASWDTTAWMVPGKAYVFYPTLGSRPARIQTFCHSTAYTALIGELCWFTAWQTGTPSNGGTASYIKLTFFLHDRPDSTARVINAYQYFECQDSKWDSVRFQNVGLDSIMPCIGGAGDRAQ